MIDFAYFKIRKLFQPFSFTLNRFHLICAMTFKHAANYIRLMVNSHIRRPLIAFKLSLKYGCYVHHSSFVDRPSRVYLDHNTNIGEGVHLRCPGNGTIQIGPNTLINPYCVLRADNGRILIGRECSLQYHSTIYGTGGVEIGDRTRISSHVLILATIHKYNEPTLPIMWQGITGKGIQIGSDVWIGAGSLILDGTTIGSHSIIGAGSVVTKDVPESCLAVGNPAHVVRSI